MVDKLFICRTANDVTGIIHSGAQWVTAKDVLHLVSPNCSRNVSNYMRCVSAYNKKKCTNGRCDVYVVNWEGLKQCLNGRWESNKYIQTIKQMIRDEELKQLKSHSHDVNDNEYIIIEEDDDDTPLRVINQNQTKELQPVPSTSYASDSLIRNDATETVKKGVSQRRNEIR
jgi:hypothetical protein